MLHIVSAIVLVLVGCGLYFRKRPAWHMRIMTSAFVMDLLLVLYIEATRHAVEKVVSQIRMMIWIHAGISLGVLVCYVVMIWLGRRALHGNKASKETHRNLGMLFVTLRGLNYATAFMV
ncbi:hypothetical protein [Humisphaera borealis]|uniref:DUF420 domain-containing protein n=1 Tax=Humisphaera borealis TaxID=2807512 RepID=A0A7M2WRV7_9BACT|nr:hypothetical protein [Humisphaera borealis]QOV88119.1 hypothetical protein IPV69_17885 [Humisphaera borealis]